MGKRCSSAWKTFFWTCFWFCILFSNFFAQLFLFNLWCTVIEAKLISLCNRPVSCSKQPALHPQLLFCPSSCLPAADLSDSGAWEELQAAWNQWSFAPELIYICFCREAEEWGNFRAALLTALCTSWIQYIANISSQSALALLSDSHSMLFMTFYWLLKIYNYCNNKQTKKLHQHQKQQERS